VLGALSLSGAEVPAARQQRVVLSALAAAWPDRVRADRLIDGVWPSERPADARKALQVLVVRLRRCLAGCNVDVTFHHGGYSLDVDEDSFDAAIFRRLCDQERAVTRDWLTERRRLLDEALELWRGEPFADVADELLLADTVAELCLRRDDVIARRHEVLLELGSIDGLVPELTGWANAHPFDEGAWCRLALCLHRAGRSTDALRALHTHRIAVRESAGLDPTARLAELEAQVLADSVPSRATARTGNLRVPTRSFVGRGSAVRAIASGLTPDAVTTLVGPAGVGKTTLALHVAGGVRRRYRDGVWICELADIANGDSIVDALASTLGVRQQRGKSLLASIAGAFQHAEALVILDNCEHVRTSAGEVVGVLHRDCPRLTVLATSREPLDIDGERVRLVEPLPTPGPDIPSSPALDLFLTRAMENGVTVQLDRSTREAVTEICRRLDGLPLAIELAAARARTMSVIEMSVRLDERFRLLTHARVDVPRRQRTLKDAVDWSYQLLADADQDLFDQLSVFLGGFTAEAAAAVAGCPVDTVEPRIWALADRSLVTLSTDGGESRYHILETLRQYGLERLEETERLSQTREAHLRYFLEFVRRAGEGLRGPDEAHYVRRVTKELANVRAAFQHAAVNRLPTEAAEMVVALHEYAEWRQFFELGTWAGIALELPIEATGVAPALHAIAGWSRCIAEDFTAAVDHAHRGLGAEARGDRECGWLHDVLAHCAYFQDDADTGLAHGEAEITRARASGDPHRLSYVLADSGTHAALHGRVEVIDERLAEALRLAADTNNPALLSMAYLAHGFRHRTEDPIQAIEWFRRAAELADTIDSTWTTGVCRGELSLLLALHGDPRAAIRLGVVQIAAFRRAGDIGRARGAIRMGIPALHRLTDESQLAQLVVLHAGTADRPHVREPFVDRAVAEVLDAIVDSIGPDAVNDAVSRGKAMDDHALLEQAIHMMERLDS
jgi:predicted ATPase/DNA-binding SARP family transcriptional activator